MNIGDRIKETRRRTGMSQVRFADEIGVSKQTLYKYENGIITNIPSDKIEAIANVGNTSPAYLMGWEEPKDYSIYIKDLENNPILVEVIENAKELSEERIKLILQMMKEMK